MDLLARREHSRRELEQKLSARGFDDALIAEVLSELEHEGLQSDARFAQSFIAGRYARGHGPSRIRRELRERGIESVERWLGDERFDWDELARATRRKRFGDEPPASLKDKSRQVRFLEYRGFSHEQIRRALVFDDE
jgi:regulatory protein